MNWNFSISSFLLLWILTSWSFYHRKSSFSMFSEWCYSGTVLRLRQQAQTKEEARAITIDALELLSLAVGFQVEELKVFQSSPSIYLHIFILIGSLCHPNYYLLERWSRPICMGVVCNPRWSRESKRFEKTSPNLEWRTNFIFNFRSHSWCENGRKQRTKDWWYINYQAFFPSHHT